MKGRSLLRMLAEAGFAAAAFHGWTGYVTSSRTQGGLVAARKPVREPDPAGGACAVGATGSGR